MYSDSAKITAVLPDQGTEFGGELHSIQTSGMASLLQLPEARKDSIRCLFGDLQVSSAAPNSAAQAITVRPAPQAWTDTNVSVACSMDGGQHYLATSAEYMLLPCSVGTFSSSPEIPCAPCAVGQYAGQRNQNACQDCPLGQHASSQGAAACDPCLEGRYSESAGSHACSACEMGTASSAQSVSICSACTSGHFTHIEGSKWCESCPLGEFNSQTRRTACEQCALGLCPPQMIELGTYSFLCCCQLTHL